MFDIGFWELTLISIVSLVVVGPERLPSVIRRCLAGVRNIKAWINRTQSEVEHQLRVQELHQNLKQAEQLDIETLSPDLKASVDELKQAAESVQNPYKNERDE